MGLLQMLLDAWLGTTGLAFLRRAGVFAAPRLEHIRHPTVRRVFGQFLQLGESSADHIEAAAKAAQAASKERGSSKVGSLSSQAQRFLQSTENSLKRLRERLNNGRHR